MGKKRGSRREEFQENSAEKNDVKFSGLDTDIDHFDEEDITDSDDQFSENEKSIIDKVRKKRVTEEVDSDDEVYGLNLSDDNDDDVDGDSMESDIERPQDNDDDMPDERAWGKKKGLYYSTDYVDQDYATTNEKDRAKAEQEENAARLIQQKIAGELDDADFDLDQFIVKKTDDEKDADDLVIKTDLSKLSKREKQALMQKESPEFQSLLNDLKDRSREVTEIIKPFLELMKTNDYPTTPATNFIKVKYQLVLNYLTNILFYLMLKANKTPITNHPVIKRLAQYRQLLTQLENSQGDLLDKVSEILAAEREGKTIYTITDSEIGPDVKIAKLKSIKDKNIEEFDDEEDDDDEDNELDENEESMQVDDEQEDMSDQKRMITYQIAKNKGLTPHRKKELRNPRVKHRNKYRKAQIRRKGAVRQVRKETTRYAGELSGIKASVTKSIKLK